MEGMEVEEWVEEQEKKWGKIGEEREGEIGAGEMAGW
jgi:hypothetical protein